MIGAACEKYACCAGKRPVCTLLAALITVTIPPGKTKAPPETGRASAPNTGADSRAKALIA